MKELLLLYWPTILAAIFTGATLSVVGALLVTRQAAVQTLAVSQSAGLGVSLGLLVSQIFFPDGHLEHTAIPLVFGLAVSAAGFASTEWIARHSHTQTVVYLAAFALFWGASQLLTGFFPVIESHATALYFGDIVTLTKGESLFFFALSGCLSVYLLLFWRGLSARAFLSAILDEPLRLRSPLDLGFYVTSLALVCLSVQMLGLLFTLSCLFVPTAVYSFSASVGVGPHLGRVALSAGVVSGSGFILSLADSRFLTTPLITVLLAIFPLVHLGLERLLFRCK